MEYLIRLKYHYEWAKAVSDAPSFQHGWMLSNKNW